MFFSEIETEKQVVCIFLKMTVDTLKTTITRDKDKDKILPTYYHKEKDMTPENLIFEA